MPRKSKAKSSAAKPKKKGPPVMRDETRASDDELRESLRRANLRVFDKALGLAFKPPDDERGPKS